jgi:hypothetical protein
MRRKYNVKLKTGTDGVDKHKPAPTSTASRGVDGRQAAEPRTGTTTPPEKASVTSVRPPTPPNVSLAATNPGKLPTPRDAPSIGSCSTASEPDEADDTFAMLNSFIETDTDMLAAFTQMAERKVEDGRRAASLDIGLAPKPLSMKGKKTIARVSTSDSQWFRKPETMCES